MISRDDSILYQVCLKVAGEIIVAAIASNRGDVPSYHEAINDLTLKLYLAGKGTLLGIPMEPTE